MENWVLKVPTTRHLGTPPAPTSHSLLEILLCGKFVMTKRNEMTHFKNIFYLTRASFGKKMLGLFHGQSYKDRIRQKTNVCPWYFQNQWWPNEWQPLYVSLCQHNFKVKWGSNIREFKKQQDAMPETTPQINDVFGEMKIIMLHMQHCKVS